MALYNLMASQLDQAYGDSELITAASSESDVTIAWQTTKKAIAAHMAFSSSRPGQPSALDALSKRYKGDESWPSFIRWVKNALLISQGGQEASATQVCIFLFSRMKDCTEPIRTLCENADLEALKKYLCKFGVPLYPAPKSLPQVASVSIDAAKEHVAGLLDIVQQTEQTPAVVAALQQARPVIGNPPKRDLSTVKCYRCEMLGHLARDCTAKPHPKGQALSK